MSSWASQAYTFLKPVCYRLTWWHWLIVQRVHTTGVFSPSGWGQVFDAKLCRQLMRTNGSSVLWLDIADLSDHCPVIPLQVLKVLLCQVSQAWSIALHTQELYMRPGVLKERGGKRELVAAPRTSSRRFSHMLWLKVHSHQLLRACLLGNRRKLPPPACQVWLGLPSVVCCLRDGQFPGTVYTCNQGPLWGPWAHCIPCAPSAYSRCRRCCCCQLQCNRLHMETCLNSAGGPGRYHRSRSSSFLHLLSALSPPLLFSKSRASWHIPSGELTRQGFKHNDEEQWTETEYRAFVNTDFHFKLFTVFLTNTIAAPRIGIHPLD